MQKKPVYKCSVNWGWLIILVIILIFFITAIQLFYLFRLFLSTTDTQTKLYLTLLSLAPLITLHILFLPAIKHIFQKALSKNKADLILYTSGIEIKGNFFEWKQIKSISFATGRGFFRKDFFNGIKLPILQKIYLLDVKGNEYSCTIDIDYSLKGNREKNHLRELQKMLLGMDKLDLVSDWAER